MNKTLKTYAVYGLIEWHAQLRSGKAVLNVDFTGGTTGYGTTPAMYSTDNLVKQCIIENSIQFKRGKIKLYSMTELDKAETGYVAGEKTLSDDAEPQDGEAVNEVEGTPAEVVNEPPPSVEVREVEVTDFDDAKTYLNQELGIPVRNLRSHDAIIREAAANGIRFKGI